MSTAIIKLCLLITGISAIIAGFSLWSVPLSLIVGGAMFLALLWLLSIAETRGKQ